MNPPLILILEKHEHSLWLKALWKMGGKGPSQGKRTLRSQLPVLCSCESSNHFQIWKTCHIGHTSKFQKQVQISFAGTLPSSSGSSSWLRGLTSFSSSLETWFSTFLYQDNLCFCEAESKTSPFLLLSLMPTKYSKTCLASQSWLRVLPNFILSVKWFFLLCNVRASFKEGELVWNLL